MSFSIVMLCPIIPRFDKTAGFGHSYLSLLAVAVKMFRAALEFINVRLQQQDQVASMLRTVDF